MQEPQYYTVTGAKRLEGQDNYGNVTDSVYFEGETDSALWKHAPSTNVEQGVKVFGIIETLPTKAGGTYRKFTKKMLPEGTFTPSQNTTTTTTPSQNAPQTASKAFSGTSNGGDGARQGMAINNAAKYVVDSAVRDNISLEPQELADEITRYAREIYKINLTISVEDEVRDILN